VSHVWGPERIETGWWRGADIRRDYFLVETTAGERFWLFRSLADNTWFLHGVFA
jgi:protein ImuB